MTKKIITALLLVAILVSTVSAIPAYAASAADAMPPAPRRFENIVYIAPGLSVSGTTASYSLTVSGATNVTKISAILQIQKMNSNGTYSDYGSSWTASSTASYLRTTGEKTVASGGTYRLKAVVTAVSNITSTETSYS